MSKNSLVIELKDAYNKSREIFTNARNKNKNLSDINSLNENQHIAWSFVVCNLCWVIITIIKLDRISRTNNRLTDLERWQA